MPPPTREDHWWPPPSPHHPAPSVTLHGDALSWLDLMLTGAIDAQYPIAAHGDGSQLHLNLRLSDDELAAARTVGYLDLLDAEGVTLRVPTSTATSKR